jgi:hypothetical protein
MLILLKYSNFVFLGTKFSISFQNPSGNTDIRPSVLHADYLKRPLNSDSNTGHDEASPFRKRVSESIDVFCKLKDRRLQDFYREQMTVGLRSGGTVTKCKEDEVASDLTTKSSQTLEQIASNSPSEYQKATSLPLTMPLQQQLKPLPESKLSNCDTSLLHKENVKGDDNEDLTENCDTEAKSIDVNSEQSNSVSMDDANSQMPVGERLKQDRRHEAQGYVQEDCDVKILDDTRRTIFTKNDSNNNNNSGELNSLIIFNAVNVRY